MKFKNVFQGSGRSNRFLPLKKVDDGLKVTKYRIAAQSTQYRYQRSPLEDSCSRL